jgi:hypothetical protein
VHEQVTCLGGNAANSVTVLRQLRPHGGNEGEGEGDCELFAAIPRHCHRIARFFFAFFHKI